MGDISKTNYRKPIYWHFSNYRQNDQYRKFEFGNYQQIINIGNFNLEFRNYRQIIDIGKYIKFGPINIWKAKLSEI